MSNQASYAGSKGPKMRPLLGRRKPSPFPLAKSFYTFERQRGFIGEKDLEPKIMERARKRLPLSIGVSGTVPRRIITFTLTDNLPP